MEYFTGAASIRLNRDFEQIKKRDEIEKRADEFFEKIKANYTVEIPEESELKRRFSMMAAIVVGSILVLALTRYAVKTDSPNAKKSIIIEGS